MKNPFLVIADKPVVEGLEHHEVKIVGQRTLTANTADGRVLTRWVFNEEQRLAISQGADLYLMQETFGKAMMPTQIMIYPGELNRDFVYRDFQLYKCATCGKAEVGEPHGPNCPNRGNGDEAEPVPTTVVVIDYESVEQRLIALMIQRGLLPLLDKILQKQPLSEIEQGQLDELNKEISG